MKKITVFLCIAFLSYSTPCIAGMAQNIMFPEIVETDLLIEGNLTVEGATSLQSTTITAAGIGAENVTTSTIAKLTVTDYVTVEGQITAEGFSMGPVGASASLNRMRLNTVGTPTTHSILSAGGYFDGSLLPLGIPPSYYVTQIFGQAKDDGTGVVYIGILGLADSNRDASEQAALFGVAYGANTYGFGAVGGTSGDNVLALGLVAGFADTALSIQQFDLGSGDGVTISHLEASNTGCALLVDHDGTGEAVSILSDNSANTNPALKVRQDGPGDIASFYDSTTLKSGVNDTGQFYHRNTNEDIFYFNADGGAQKLELTASGLRLSTPQLTLSEDLSVEGTSYFLDAITIDDTKRINFFNTNNYIGASDNNTLAITAQNDIQITTPTVNMSGDLALGGSLELNTGEGIVFDADGENTNTMGYNGDEDKIVVEGDVLFGDSVEIDINLDVNGNQTFAAQGAGLPFGEIWTVANTFETTITTAGAFVQYTEFENNGMENLTIPDYTQDHITVEVTGIYLVVCSFHIESIGAGAADLVSMEIRKNDGNTIFSNLHAHRKLAGGGGDVGSISISGLAPLNANDTVELWLTNDDNATNLIVVDANISILQIGGGVIP